MLAGPVSFFRREEWCQGGPERERERERKRKQKQKQKQKNAFRYGLLHYPVSIGHDLQYLTFYSIQLKLLSESPQRHPAAPEDSLGSSLVSYTRMAQLPCVPAKHT